MKESVKKVYAYPVRKKKNPQLLVFSHKDHPEAGIQIPGGTLENSENPREGVKREMMEETGLTDFTVERSFEKSCCEFEGEKLERYFFLLNVKDEEDHWNHKVSGDGEDSGLVFRCFWLEEEEFEVLPDYFTPFLDPEHIPFLFD